MQKKYISKFSGNEVDELLSKIVDDSYIINNTETHIKKDIFTPVASDVLYNKFKEISNTFIEIQKQIKNISINDSGALNEIIGIDDNGDVYIKKNGDKARNFWTYGAISFGNKGEDDNINGVTYLRGLNDVSLSENINNGESLVYEDGYWINKIIKQGLDEQELAKYLYNNKYAQKDYVTEQIISEFDKFGIRLVSYTENDETKYYIELKYDLVALGTISFGKKGNDNEENVGGITEITYDMVITALGYTPYNSTNPSKYITESDANNTYASKTLVDTLKTDFDNLNTLLNTNTSGVIDTWNEVVAFLNTYSDSQDLASILSVMNTDINNRALQTDLDAAIIRIKTIEDTYVDKDSNQTIKGIKTFENGFNLGITVISEKEQNKTKYVEIDGNLVVTGTISFGEFGENTGGSGGITEVTYDMVVGALGYTPYSSTNPNGYITAGAIPSYLPNPYALTINGKLYDGSAPVNVTISGGVADSIDWVNVYNKPTTLGGYGITDAVVGSKGNGYTFFRYNGFYIVNYGGSDWRLTNSGWQTEYKILHADNYSNYALPLSGGTITGKTTISTSGWGNQLVINRSEGNGAPSVAFSNVGNGILGYIGIGGTASLIGTKPFYEDASGNTYSLLHSGNYSSYALPLSGGTINGMLTVKRDATVPLYVHTSVDTVYTFMRFKINNVNRASVGAHRDNEYLYRSNSDLSSYYKIYDEGNFNPANYLPLSGGTMVSGAGIYSHLDSVYGAIAFNKDHNAFGSPNVPTKIRSSLNPIYTNGSIEYSLIHSGNIGSYNAGSATKLQTARTIWGNSFNGTSDINGVLLMPNNVAISAQSSSATELECLKVSSSNNLRIGYGISAVGGNTNIYGNRVLIRYSNANTTGISLEANGNVLIGGTTDYSGKLQVNHSAWDNGIIINRTVAGGGASITVRSIGTLLGSFGINGSKQFEISFGGDKVVYCDSSGSFVASGSITFGSDQRYKDILSNVSVDLETIANAPLFNYKWTDSQDERTHLGTTAQYWNNTAFKNAVIPTNDATKWTMSYSEIAMGNTIVIARELIPIKSDVQILKERVEKLKRILTQHNIKFD